MSSKYDNMMKCAQVRSLANEKQYRNAYEVTQTINIDEITSITDLNTIADVYIQLQKYAEAKGIYLKLYERFPTRRVIYQLVYLSLKCGEIEEAEEYYSEYETMDKSIDRIILRYYIDKAKGASRQTLIRYLQELKRVDYTEEWAYELAKLYHKEGMSEECVQECSDIILWFGEGLIVEKAMLLKHHYMDGADISSESAIIEETRNLAAELRIAAAIAERNEREQAKQEQAEQEQLGQEPVEQEQLEQIQMEEAERAQADREAELLYVKPENRGVEVTYEPVYTEEPVSVDEPMYEEQPAYEEEPVFEEPSAYEEESVFEEPSAYEDELMYEETSAYEDEPLHEEQPTEEEESVGAEVEDYEEPAYEEQDEEEAGVYDDAIFEGGLSEIEAAIEEIVADIKDTKSAGHIAITGEVSDKNIEIGKCLAKELYRQQILPTSKIARISAVSLNDVSLLDNRQQLEGGCLLIEEASQMTLASIQNLYQLVRKTKGNMVVILSDTEAAMESLLKKNRKLGKMIEYHIEI